jgi:hypothetical protein
MWVVVIGQVELIVRVCCRTVWETNMRLMFVQWLVVRGAVPTHRLIQQASETLLVPPCRQEGE